MKIAIMGAGGLGSYLGGLLARSGNEVTLVCRGRHLEAIRAHGLRVQRDDGQFTADLKATDDPQQAGIVDAIIVGVKLYDLANAAVQMRPMVGPHTMVVPIQNGVNSHEIIDARLGAGHATGGTAFLSASVVEPGVVKGRSRVDRLVFGEIDGRQTPRALAFHQACRAAGIDAVLSTCILRDMWEKFILIAATSAVCCLSRQSVGYVCADDALRALLMQGMQEAMAVARALDIPVAEDSDQKGLAFNRSVAYGTRVSMLEDIDNGKPLELDWLSGHLVELARRTGQAVPLHTIAHACLAPYSKGTRAAQV